MSQCGVPVGSCGLNAVLRDRALEGAEDKSDVAVSADSVCMRSPARRP